MLKSYSVEINPTIEQAIKINKTIGVCRYIYNFYLAHNKEVYEKDGRFVTGYDFSKWLNNEFIPNNQEYVWVKEVSSKAVKQSIMQGEKAFKNFFKGKSKYPRYKKKNKSNVKAYLPKNNPTDWAIERHRVKIPTLGWVRVKEKGYIPTTANVRSGTVSCKAGRYYVSVLVEEEIILPSKPTNEPLGIDLGLKEFAICSNGKLYKNINKTKEVKRLEKKLKREQKCLSRKYENKKKGEATNKNIQKQVLKVQCIHQRLDNIRTDYISKTVSEIVKTKPSYITIEDLNVSGMMKNRHLSKAIASQNFYTFRVKLAQKCKENSIELRIADRWFPSSKLCHNCGCIKKGLKLSDRVYTCECGYRNDRDINASLNLRDTKTYKIA